MKKVFMTLSLLMIAAASVGCSSKTNVKKELQNFEQSENPVLDWTKYEEDLMLVLEENNSDMSNKMAKDVKKNECDLPEEYEELVEECKDAVTEYVYNKCSVDVSDQMDQIPVKGYNSEIANGMGGLTETYAGKEPSKIWLNMDNLNRNDDDSNRSTMVHELLHAIGIEDNNDEFIFSYLMEGYTEDMTEECITTSNINDKRYKNESSYVLNKKIVNTLLNGDDTIFKLYCTDEDTSMCAYIDEKLGSGYAEQLEYACALYDYYTGNNMKGKANTIRKEVMAFVDAQ